MKKILISLIILMLLLVGCKTGSDKITPQEMYQQYVQKWYKDDADLYDEIYITSVKYFYNSEKDIYWFLYKIYEGTEAEDSIAFLFMNNTLYYTYTEAEYEDEREGRDEMYLRQFNGDTSQYIKQAERVAAENKRREDYYSEYKKMYDCVRNEGTFVDGYGLKQIYYEWSFEPYINRKLSLGISGDLFVKYDQTFKTDDGKYDTPILIIRFTSNSYISNVLEFDYYPKETASTYYKGTINISTYTRNGEIEFSSSSSDKVSQYITSLLDLLNEQYSIRKLGFNKFLGEE